MRRSSQGIDILDTKVYWRFPSGVVRCVSARGLRSITAAEMDLPQTAEEYQVIGTSLGYEFLGGRCDVTGLLAEPGLLRGEQWRALAWSLPENSVAPCWWLTNPRGDPEDAPKYLNRSLAVLRAELGRSQVATLEKISAEFRRRQESNESVRCRLAGSPLWIATAQSSQQQILAQPTSDLLRDLSSWCESLRQQDLVIADTHSDYAAESQFMWQEIASLVGSLLSESAEDIHEEHFAQTPLELFREMVCAWLARAHREAATTAWSHARLSAAAAEAAADATPDGDVDAPDAVAEVPEAASADVGVPPPDPDGFATACQRLPKRHVVATAHAEAVLLDRLRAMLDTHYDDVFQEEWHSRHLLVQAGLNEAPPAVRARQRPGAHRVDRRVLEARATCRYETFCIPEAVKTLLRRPSDMSDWAKLEKLAKIVLDLAGGLLTVTVADAASLVMFADAVATDMSGTIVEDLELDGLLLEQGMRVIRPFSAKRQTPMQERPPLRG